MAESCGNCRFMWSRGKQGGTCRRYPPMVIPPAHAEAANQTNASPWMMHTEWCGEWRPLPEGERNVGTG